MSRLAEVAADIAAAAGEAEQRQAAHHCALVWETLRRAQSGGANNAKREASAMDHCKEGESCLSIWRTSTV